MIVDVLPDKVFDSPLGSSGTESMVALALRNKGYDLTTKRLQEFIMEDPVAKLHYEHLSRAAAIAIHPCDHQVHVVTCANRLLQYKAITLHPRFSTIDMIKHINDLGAQIVMYTPRRTTIVYAAILSGITTENGVINEAHLVTPVGQLSFWPYDLKKVLNPFKTDSKIMFEVE